MRDIQAYAQERFVDDTREHVMQVLHEDGLYKHLRFKQPGSIIYYFDLVTWPGHLAICGDAGDFVFSREQDMIGFFRREGVGPRINPQYWSEKLVAPRGPDAAMEFSQQRYVERVKEWISELPEAAEDRGVGAVAAAEEDLLRDLPMNEYEAHERLRDFKHNEIWIDSAWEWGLRDYRFDFLWCCWAIAWGLHTYVQESRLKPRRWWRRGR